jgi:hypothetical protein
MFPEKRQRTQDKFEQGTLLRITFSSDLQRLSKQAMQSVVMHFGNPLYVDLTKTEGVVVRFATKECLSAFMAKVTANGIDATDAFLQVVAVQAHA